MAIDDNDLAMGGAPPTDPTAGAMPMGSPGTPIDVDALVAAINAKGYPVAFTAEVKLAAARLERGSPDFHRLRMAIRPFLTAAGVMRDWDQEVDVERGRLAAAAASGQSGAGGAAVATRYAVKDGRICVVKESEGGVITTPLANFNARILEEILVDDGAEATRRVVVAGRLSTGELLPRVTIAVEEFHRASLWTVREWGARATVGSGQSTQDQFREALQVLSRPVVRRVYRHTGWREVVASPGGGTPGWAYLYNGGSVGGGDTEVALDGPMLRYSLPASVDSPRETMAASLRLLSVAPLAIMGPLLAAVGLAPLAHWIRPDFVVWLLGRTGSFKSEIAALAQAHFGPFNRLTLPGNWSSTENALEGAMFAAKDALFTIDDYAPQPSAREQSELDRKVARIIRNIGNGTARGRLRADLSQRPDRPPRCMVVSSGETIPPGHSIGARLSVVPVDRSAVEVAALTRSQAEVALLPHALRAYVEWLQSRLPPSALVARHAELRASYMVEAAHARAPEAMAKLHLGLSTYLECAVAVGATTQAAASDIITRFRSALLGLADHQAAGARDTTPARRFIRVVSTLISQDRLRLLTDPRSPLEDRDVDLLGDGTPVVGPPVEKVGWREQPTGLIYLHPEVSFHAVGRYLREAGEHWPVGSVRTLGEELANDGFVSRDPKGRTQHLKRLGPSGARVRVFVLPATAIDGEGEDGDGNGLSPQADPLSPHVTSSDPDDFDLFSQT
jgi:hypothetical protein